jgi:hypothetical protein
LSLSPFTDASVRIGACRPSNSNYRPPEQIAVTTVKALKFELAQRKAKPRDRNLTQENGVTAVE